MDKPKNLQKILFYDGNRYMPKAIIRTESLNEDFHKLAASGRLNFMNLPLDWKSKFHIKAKSSNQSVLSSRANKNILEDYLNDDWKQLIKSKSSIYQNLKLSAEIQLQHLSI